MHTKTVIKIKSEYWQKHLKGTDFISLMAIVNICICVLWYSAKLSFCLTGYVRQFHLK